jgi:hypothetical protein
MIKKGYFISIRLYTFYLFKYFIGLELLVNQLHLVAGVKQLLP